MKMPSLVLLPLLILAQPRVWGQETSHLLQLRTNLILKAVNSRPEKIIETLDAADVELGAFDGRVVVNKKAKFTYYVHIDEANNPNSKIILIPMSTSRFTPTYYQTDAWWDAHKTEIDEAKKSGRPMPRQEMNEILTWLEQMKLNTNPDVIIIEPSQDRVNRVPLQDYLLDIYLNTFVENGKVVLYRGAEKPGELDSWLSGQTPKGVRYWTPTANYAWRYARKNSDFLNLLLAQKTPLFRFEVPINDFKQMIQRRWQRLTLGTELTKKSHQIFDSSRYFGDQLYSGQAYLGIGNLGLEFELRSNRFGAQDMVKYFKRPATIADLAEDRIRVIRLAFERLRKHQANPEQEAKLKTQLTTRIEQVRLEQALIEGLLERRSPADIEGLLQQYRPEQRPEIGNIDDVNFRNWVLEKVRTQTIRCQAVL